MKPVKHFIRKYSVLIGLIVFSISVFELWINAKNLNEKPNYLSNKNSELNENEEEIELARNTSCGGVERWSVKVLTDSLVNTVNFTPKNTSMAHLVAIVTPSPSTTMPRYKPVEDSTYKVTCKITIKKAEADSDYHLVLSNGTNTLIGEIPNPNCNSVALSAYANKFKACKNFIDANIAKGNVSNVNIPPVTVTGVAFIDPPHGQTGAAPNNLELHPILDIYFSSTTEVNEFMNKNMGMTVFPNPFTSFTTFVFDAEQKNAHWDIFDLSGEKVKSSDFSGKRIILEKENLKSGVYFVHIVSDNGSVVKKIIVSH